MRGPKNNLTFSFLFWTVISKREYIEATLEQQTCMLRNASEY